MKRISAIILNGLFAATLSAQQLPSKSTIIATLKRVNNYWITANANPGNNQWARAVYFTGNLDFYKLYPQTTYLDYANNWASKNNWALNGGSSTRVADNQTAGQVYLDLYQMDSVKQPNKMAAIKTAVDNMVYSSKSDDWWWVDALYMAMPVFTRLGALTNDTIYFSKMYQLYSNTKTARHLFNTTEHLWYRDESFLPPYTTPNGQDCYWARGNGWVIAAHVRVLQLLPTNHPNREEYIHTFQQMAVALKDRQRSDGFWNASLDDPDDCGGPETSGTAFITYGLAWGINNGWLDSTTYYPVVARAWEGLSTIAVQPNGFLGFVQGVGSKPGTTNVNSTADFGVGALLLAGTELAKLAKGTMPVPSRLMLSSVSVQDQQHLLLTFTAPLDRSSALTKANYMLSGNLTISAIELSQDSLKCLLTVTGMEQGNYELQVCHLISAKGDTIDMDEASAFTYSGIYRVTASESEANTSNTPDKTLDFDFSTRWSSYGKGQWIEYDLGEPKAVQSVALSFYNGSNRKAYFSLELSDDGTGFRPVLSDTTSGTTDGLETYDIPDQTARYVRITCYGNSSSLWNSITETRIFCSLPNEIESHWGSSSTGLILTNPVKGTELVISTRLKGPVKQLVITDLAGKRLYSKTIRSNQQIIRIQDACLPSGLYVVTLQSGRFSESGKMAVE